MIGSGVYNDLRNYDDFAPSLLPVYFSSMNTSSLRSFSQHSHASRRLHIESIVFEFISTTRYKKFVAHPAHSKSPAAETRQRNRAFASWDIAPFIVLEKVPGASVVATSHPAR